ncbi:MAG TPA: hypothetical protein PLP16_07965 [Smithellaceae bacterium]|nr:hypothetical protein [Smithellaceae bacterium]
MKKINVFLFIVLLFFLSAGINEGLAVMQEQAPASDIKAPLPDLAVSVMFVHIESYTRPDGTQCFSPRPRFNIVNKGQSAANNFDYIIEWKLGPGHTWQVYTSSNPTISLMPRTSKTIDGNNAAWDQPWCTNQTDWKPGWRISVDNKKVIAESNENNNVAEKIYEPLIKPKINPVRDVKIDKHPIPIQK